MKNEPRYAQKIDWLQDRCPIKATVDVIGGRWKWCILFYLLDQPKGFSGLRKDIASVTAQMLTLQLRQLEADGIVVRTIHAEVGFASSTHSRPTAERFRPYCVVCGNGVNNISTAGTRKRAKEAEPLKPHSKGVQEFRSSGVQEFRSSGVQEFRRSGVQEFRLWRSRKLQEESVLHPLV